MTKSHHYSWIDDKDCFNFTAKELVKKPLPSLNLFKKIFYKTICKQKYPVFSIKIATG